MRAERLSVRSSGARSLDSPRATGAVPLERDRGVTTLDEISKHPPAEIIKDCGETRGVPPAIGTETQKCMGRP